MLLKDVLNVAGVASEYLPIMNVILKEIASKNMYTHHHLLSF